MNNQLTFSYCAFFHLIFCDFSPCKHIMCFYFSFNKLIIFFMYCLIIYQQKLYCCHNFCCYCLEANYCWEIILIRKILFFIEILLCCGVTYFTVYFLLLFVKFISIFFFMSCCTFLVDLQYDAFFMLFLVMLRVKNGRIMVKLLPLCLTLLKFIFSLISEWLSQRF